MNADQKAHFAGERMLDLIAITGIGAWDWDLSTDEVVYSEAWAKILGYDAHMLEQDVATWEGMVLPEDLPHAKEQIKKHLRGESPLYEGEFRMRCKDGAVIWVQNRGQVVEYDEGGKAKRFMGVLQDISRMKNVEMDLRNSQETIDFSVNAASLGTWDWDLVAGHIKYNDEYLHILGYKQREMTGSFEEWKRLNHPEDLPNTMGRLQDYIDGITPSYECETRMKHKDGSYLWTRDVGRIVARDSAGVPTRVIGAHLNIDSLKRTQAKLEGALFALDIHRNQLEKDVVMRTKALTEQDRMLWRVNDIAKRLLSFDESVSFDALVYDCLRILGEATKQNRVFIWKSIEVGGMSCFVQVNEWLQDVDPIQDSTEYQNIPYDKLPSFCKMIKTGNCLNRFVCHLEESEKALLSPLGIKSVLVAPISMQEKNWGFIGIENYKEEKLFSDLEENMLLMSGFFIASAIERNLTLDRMQEMEQMTNIMLNATPLCCNLWTKSFQNMACNEEAVRLFGLQNQEEYSERFFDLMPEFQPCGRESRDFAMEKLAQAFAHGYCKFEFVHKTLGGEVFDTEVVLVRIMHHQDYIVASYTRDLRELKAMLSEMHKVEADLRTAHEEAMLSSKAKTNFLANMSHEIRTPMNAIAGLAEIILRDKPNRQTAEHAMGIKQACHNLLSIINDILEISKIESGKLEIVEAPYLLASVLHDVISTARLRLGDKQLLFVTDIERTLPSALYGDEIRIKQIFINLLSNAIKFTQEGHFTLRVYQEPLAQGIQLVIAVSDTGMGISPKDLERLFEEFERVNTTKNRSIEGTGLGLAITKRLCEMMGGTITVESELGQGSTFTVKIPQICKDAEPIATVLKKRKVLLYEPREPYRISMYGCIRALGCECILCDSYSSLTEGIAFQHFDYIFAPSLHMKKMKTLMKKRGTDGKLVLLTEFGEAISDPEVYTLFLPTHCLAIANILNDQSTTLEYGKRESPVAKFVAPEARILVVDDSPVNLKVALGLMKSYGFQMDTAENGLEAVAMVQEAAYDLVFMDHMMPVMDGIDATVAIRGLEDENYKELPIIALTANAVVGTREMFIQEGMNDFISKPIEMNKLNTILARWLPREKQIYQGRGSEEKDMTQASDQEIIIEGVDVSTGIQMVGGSEETYLQVLTSYYNDGNEKKVSLIESFGQGDLNRFRIDVHALKSSSAIIGAGDLAKKAQALENAATQKNTVYISVSLDELIKDLTRLLEEIAPIIGSKEDGIQKKAQEGTFPLGSTERLRKHLLLLEKYIEFVQISEIEQEISYLGRYQWSEEIEGSIAQLKDTMALFEYDRALALVQQMMRA